MANQTVCCTHYYYTYSTAACHHGKGTVPCGAGNIPWPVHVMTVSVPGLVNTISHTSSPDSHSQRPTTEREEDSGQHTQGTERAEG